MSVDWIYLAQEREYWKSPWEHSNKLLGDMKIWEFLDWLMYYSILKKNSDPWNLLQTLIPYFLTQLF